MGWMVVAAMLYGTTAQAGPEESALNKCQRTVSVEGGKYIQNYVKTAGACLQKVSIDLVQKAEPTPGTGTAKACVAQYRKIRDSRLLGKSLEEKLAAKITAACSAGPFTLDDVIGSPSPGVQQPLDAEKLAAYCQYFGGDGTVNSVAKWTDCVVAAHTCAARSALATQYPRAVEWLGALVVPMNGVPSPLSDLNRTTDAVAGVQADETAIDGTPIDGQPDLTCGNVASVGTAVAGDVLSGKTFSNSSSTNIAGTMPDRGGVNIIPGTSSQTIQQGYHDGTGSVAGDADLVAGNIRSGVEIFGVMGTSPAPSGNATAADVLAGKTFSNMGGGSTGTMPDNGMVNIMPGVSNQPIPAGYHNGMGSVAGDADLVSGNIRSGVEIFGVSGSPSVVNTSAATVTAAEMLSGKTAYVNGNLVLGMVAAGANVSGANGQTSFLIPDGMYTGSKTATANDSNLVVGNIKSGQTIFGVTGTRTHKLPRSGQTTSDGAGSDGAVQAGSAMSFTDNGNGTITDNVTGLMWEKKDDSGGIHDMDNVYTWSGASYGTTNETDGTAFTTFLTTLNTPPCFAGHCDWRLPNFKELQSIVDYEIPYPGPVVREEFHRTTTCTGCTDVNLPTCSCTAGANYWSSTTPPEDRNYAWYVYFEHGSVNGIEKNNLYAVRAVRGGM